MFTAQMILGSVLVMSLIGSDIPVGVSSDRDHLSLTKTTWVKVHTGGQLKLQCGNRMPTGMVQYWHTPFGQVKKNSVHDNQDPVAMQSDGSLKINRISRHHSGLYYCLLVDGNGTTLQPYRLDTEEDQHDHRMQRGGREHSLRPQRSLEDQGYEEERAAAGVSDGQLAGAVAASVVVTFLVGFGSGALSRAPLLRCMGAARAKVQSLRHGRSQTPDHHVEVTLATLPSMCENEEPYEDSASARGVTIATVTPSPPAKPQRSFRRGRAEEEPEAATYLEGCDGDNREGEKGSGVEGRGDGSEGEEGGGDSEWKGENEGEVKESASGSSGDESEPEQRGFQAGQETTGEGEGRDEVACSPSRPTPRSRVIRLYQYDEEGHRYGHLPNPGLLETEPAPRPKQRSLSLTRLSTIMAAASSSPMDPPSRDEEREERDHPSSPSQERPVFQLDI